MNLDDLLVKHQVREVIVCDCGAQGPGFSTTVEALRLREWLLGPGQATLVMDQFSSDGFHLVVDDRADVHVNSKDGRFYLGWFPLGHPRRPR